MKTIWSLFAAFILSMGTSNADTLLDLGVIDEQMLSDVSRVLVSDGFGAKIASAEMHVIQDKKVIDALVAGVREAKVERVDFWLMRPPNLVVFEGADGAILFAFAYSYYSKPKNACMFYLVTKVDGDFAVSGAVRSGHLPPFFGFCGKQFDAILGAVAVIKNPDSQPGQSKGLTGKGKTADADPSATKP